MIAGDCGLSAFFPLPSAEVDPLDLACKTPQPVMTQIYSLHDYRHIYSTAAEIFVCTHNVQELHRAMVPQTVSG